MSSYTSSSCLYWQLSIPFICHSQCVSSTAHVILFFTWLIQSSKLAFFSRSSTYCFSKFSNSLITRTAATLVTSSLLTLASEYHPKPKAGCKGRGRNSHHKPSGNIGQQVANSGRTRGGKCFQLFRV